MQSSFVHRCGVLHTALLLACFVGSFLFWPWSLSRNKTDGASQPAALNQSAVFVLRSMYDKLFACPILLGVLLSTGYYVGKEEAPRPRSTAAPAA